MAYNDQGLALSGYLKNISGQLKPNIFQKLKVPTKGKLLTVEPLQNTFRLYVQFLDDEGLLGKTTIGIDGSKFKAVNSRKNNYNQKKKDKRQRFIAEKTAKYLQELDELDKEELTACKDEMQ